MSKQDGSRRQTSASDDLGAHILHVDMDAFFASVELLEHPELVGKPVIIGHPAGRSVVLSATYEARRLGVHSAMPMAIAMRRAPDAIVLAPHHSKYGVYSRQVIEVFQSFTPLVEQLSIDEAFLDVAGAVRLIGSPATIGALVRERVFAATGLRCSVGAASTKFIAKLASSQAKPDGLLVVPPDRTLDFLHPLPVSALWGVGASTQERLSRLALHTIGDIADMPVEALKRAVGEATGAKLHALSWARDDRAVTTVHVEKSIGHERTFGTDLTDPAAVQREILRLSGQVGARLRSHSMLARTISIKVRTTDFSTLSRSRTLQEPTDVARRIYTEASEMFALLPAAPVRLIGVRAEQLTTVAGEPQLALWEDAGDDEWSAAERTIDDASKRFGSDAIMPANLMTRPQPE